MNELVKMVVDEVGIDEGQAKGGLGLLLKVAQQRLEGGDFAQIAAVVDDVEKLIAAAPEQGGVAKVAGNIASALGGDKVTDLAALVSAFSKLNIDREQFLEVAEVLIGFVQERGGDPDNKLFAKIMSGGKLPI